MIQHLLVILTSLHITHVIGRAVYATGSPYCNSRAIGIGETIMSSTAIADDQGRTGDHKLVIEKCITYLY